MAVTAAGLSEPEQPGRGATGHNGLPAAPGVLFRRSKSLRDSRRPGCGDALVEDGAATLQGDGSGRFQEKRQRERRAGQADGDVDRVDERLVELLGVADDGAVVEEERVARAVRGGVSAQGQERLAPRAGQDRRGKQGEPAVGEGDGGAETAREALAGPEQSKPAAGDGFDRPRAGGVGPRGW